jgi:septal ring factor EnvC (AmiA/AmiB activator)
MAQSKEMLLLKEIKADIEELKEMIYPETRIRQEFVEEIKRMEREMAKGKAKKFKSKKEVKEWLKKL